MNKREKLMKKMSNIGLAFGLSLIAIGILLTNELKTFQGIGALIVLITEAYYFFKITFG